MEPRRYSAATAATRYSFEDLAFKISSFYGYNANPARYLPCHILLQKVSSGPSKSAERKVSLSTVRQIIEEESRIEKESWGRTMESAGLELAEPSKPIMDKIPEFVTMREDSRVIYNPGAPGQMYNYALDRFRPFEAHLRNYLGFTALEACVSARLIQYRAKEYLRPYNQPGSPPYERSRGPAHYQRVLLIPPKEFLRRWREATVLTKDSMQELMRGGFRPEVVEFLSGDREDFSSQGNSFSRWAFLKNSDGSRSLLIPGMLVDTLVSALHLGLLDSLPPKEKGEYGRLLGGRFEDLVAGIFEVHYAGVSIDVHKPLPDPAGDIDLLVRLDPGVEILIQCKGRILRPVGRWSREEFFFSDVQRNILKAAEQASRALSAYQGRRNVFSVFLVLDAYFPVAGAFARAGQEIGRAMRKLPNPVVLSYYDLEYLLRRVPANELQEYLTWREGILKSGRFVVHDELDLVRLYGQGVRAELEKIKEREGNLLFIGHDDEFQANVLREFDERVDIQSLFLRTLAD